MTFRVFDCHIHIQPWEQLHPAALRTMIRGRSDADRLERILADPARARLGGERKELQVTPAERE